MRHSAHERAVAKHTQHAYGSMRTAATSEMCRITATQPQTATARAAHTTNAAMPAGCNQKITGHNALRASCPYQQACACEYTLEGRIGFFLHTCHIARHMQIYSAVHTGAKIHPGGAQSGFINAA